MASTMIYLTEGSRFLLSSWKNRLHHKKYTGKANEICQKIVEDCWNGRYLQLSTFNFTQFWTRDFGFCTQSLIKLSYRDKVHQTLRYALNRFKKYDQITTTITSGGKPYDYPTYAVDSLPWLIHSIKISKFHYYFYKPFLDKEINKFFNKVIDPTMGLVKSNVHFSSMKDQAIRKSSCYDNCMVALLANDLNGMKLINPFTKFDYPKLIKRHFWNGKYFYDDLSKQNYVAGDANLFPFLLGLITDKEMINSALAEIRAAGLDKPFPLKYTSGKEKVKFIWQEKLVMPNYETNAIWAHMGILYTKWMQNIDPKLAQEYKEAYTQLIEKYQGFVEVFSADGQPYHSWFYYADRGMLWAVNYLTL